MLSGDIILCLLGAIVGLLGVAASSLWPNQKWVGKVALLLVAILLSGSACLAFGSFIGGALTALIVLVAGAIWFWWSSRPALLRVENPTIQDRAVEYGDQRQRLYIGHVDVRNPRSDTAASNCEIRLVKIGESTSHDTKPLKVTGEKDTYARSISPSNPGTFDLFGIDAESFPNTYLLSNSDVAISPILSVPQTHLLTYEISAIGFSTIRATIAVDLTGNPPPINPDYTIYSGSGAPSTLSVTSSPQAAFDDSTRPLQWDPTPRIWIVEQGPA